MAEEPKIEPPRVETPKLELANPELKLDSATEETTDASLLKLDDEFKTQATELTLKGFDSLNLRGALKEQNYQEALDKGPLKTLSDIKNNLNDAVNVYQLTDNSFACQRVGGQGEAYKINDDGSLLEATVDKYIPVGSIEVGRLSNEYGWNPLDDLTPANTEALKAIGISKEKFPPAPKPAAPEQPAPSKAALPLSAEQNALLAEIESDLKAPDQEIAGKYSNRLPKTTDGTPINSADEVAKLKADLNKSADTLKSKKAAAELETDLQGSSQELAGKYRNRLPKTAAGTPIDTPDEIKKLKNTLTEELSGLKTKIAAAEKPATGTETEKPTAPPKFSLEKQARLTELQADLAAAATPEGKAALIEKYKDKIPKKEGKEDRSEAAIQTLVETLTKEKAALAFEKETGEAPDVSTLEDKEGRMKNVFEQILTTIKDFLAYFKSSGVEEAVQDGKDFIAGKKKDDKERSDKVHYPTVAVMADMFGVAKRDEIKYDKYSPENGLVLHMKPGTEIRANGEGTATFDASSNTVNLKLFSGQNISMGPMDANSDLFKDSASVSIDQNTVLGKASDKAPLSFKEKDKDGMTVDPTSRFPGTTEIAPKEPAATATTPTAATEAAKAPAAAEDKGKKKANKGAKKAGG